MSTPAPPRPRFDRRQTDFQEERRRRRERWLIAIVCLLIVLFTSFEVRLSRFSEGLPVTNNLLFFTLVNVNVILALLLLFLVFRNVGKLVFDRRANVGGLTLRTKLILAFAGFTLIPAVLLFSVATGFVVNSVNSWFEPSVETSLQDALELSRDLYQRGEEDARLKAERVAAALSERDLLRSGASDELLDTLEKERDLLGIDQVEVLSPTEASLAKAFDHKKLSGEVPGGRGPVIPPLGANGEAPLVSQAIVGKTGSLSFEASEHDVIRGVAPVWPRDCPEYSRTEASAIRGCRPVGAVAVSSLTSESTKAKADRIFATRAGYKQVKDFKIPLKSSYVVLLTTITLLVVFAATWLGIHLSREIAAPLRSLAEGTRAVAGGNLDVEVPDPGSDEIGQVVRAFNKMTADLKASRAGLESANADLKRSNVELEQRRRYMEVVLTNIGAGVVAIDREARFQAINDAAARLLAIEPSTVIGRRYREVLPSAYLDVAHDFVRELERSQASSVSRQVSISIKGEVKTVMLTVSALKDQALGYLGMVVVLDDLTPILRAQRVAAWREVARRIAHEIKNPLTPVQLSAQRLRRRFAGQIQEGKDVFDECTATIERQVEELRRMVNEFSEFARLPEAHPVPEDLNATVAEAVTLYRNAHTQGLGEASGGGQAAEPEGASKAGQTIEIGLSADPAVPVFELDREQLKRAMINLLDNACAAVTQAGGREVSVTTSYDRPLGIVRVTVADDGTGMSDEVKARLFEPYFSTKKGGTGLGLTIVHRIVADHEGFIRVQDNRPRGTRFIIELPARGAGGGPRAEGAGGGSRSAAANPAAGTPRASTAGSP